MRGLGLEKGNTESSSRGRNKIQEICPVWLGNIASHLGPDQPARYRCRLRENRELVFSIAEHTTPGKDDAMVSIMQV